MSRAEMGRAGIIATSGALGRLGLAIALALALFAPADAAQKADEVLPGGPQALPIIGVTGEGMSCVIGGALAGKLLTGDEIRQSIRPKQEYSLTTLDEGPGDIVWAIGTPKEVGTDGDCERHYQQELSLGPAQLGRNMLAVLGDKRAVQALLPAHIEMLPKTDEEARKLAADFLAAKAVEEREADGESANTDTAAERPRAVRIEQAMRVDLDGDGKPDLLVNALDTKRVTAEKGEYSLVLARLSTAQAPVALAADITPETTDYPSVLWENTIVAILDLDGDRVMEVVLRGEFFHGDGWEVIHLKDGKPESALFCGCGG